MTSLSAIVQGNLHAADTASRAGGAGAWAAHRRVPGAVGQPGVARRQRGGARAQPGGARRARARIQRRPVRSPPKKCVCCVCKNAFVLAWNKAARSARLYALSLPALNASRCKLLHACQRSRLTRAGHMPVRAAPLHALADRNAAGSSGCSQLLACTSPALTLLGTLCRARKTALQGLRKAEPHRRSAPGGRASGTGGSYAGGGVRAGLGLGSAGAGETLPTRGSSPALTHGLLRNTFEANGSSTPGMLCLCQRWQI